MKPKLFLLGIFLVCALFSDNIAQGGRSKNSSNDVNTSAVFQLKYQSQSLSHQNTGIINQLSSTNIETYIPIVFSTHHTRILTFLYSGDIWSVEENGTNLRRITNIGNVTGYCWSPEGKRIAFLTSDNYGYADIYLVDADGSNLNHLKSGIQSSRVIDWNGSKIAFLRNLGYTNVRISYIDLNEAAYPIHDISPILENFGMGVDPITDIYLQWSPDGHWVVLKHGSAHGITSSDGDLFINNDFINPRWKNDSSQIISPAMYPDNGIYFFNPNNSNSGYLSQVNNHVAVYSPDDEYILYCDEYALRLMRFDDTQHTTVAYVKATDPVWTPTGEKIAYVSWKFNIDYGGSELTGIHLINSDGSNPIQVFAGWAYSPQWQP